MSILRSRAFSLKNQRKFIFLCLAAAVAVIIFGVIYYIDKFEDQLNRDTNLRLEETAQFAADHIVTVVSETQKTLRSVAAALALMPDEASRIQYLRQVSAQFGFVYMGYAEENGNLRATIASESGDVSGEAYFKAAMKGKGTISDYIRKIFINRAARGILVTVPIESQGPRPDPSGVLIAMIEARRLKEAFNLQSFNGEGYAYIINRDGMVVMRTRSLDFDNIFLAWSQRKFFGGSLEDFRRAVASGHDGMAIFADASGRRQFVYHYALPFNHWTLINMVSEDAVAGTHISLMKELTFFGSVMTLIFAAIVGWAFYSYWVAYKSRISAQTKSNFLSSMSHEIRTPLNGIIGLNFLMRSHVDNRDKMLGYLDQSQTTAQYLLTLINDILDINKLDANKMELSVSPFDLAQMVDAIVAVFSSTMHSRQINFTVEKSITHPMLMGDEVRLKQILTNIIGNASKFTPPDGDIKFTIIQYELVDKVSRVRFIITDTGCGMSEEFQKKIFDPFSQEKNTVSTGSKGTGLGMAISHQLAQKMAGDLSVWSELGKGSTFTLEIPFPLAADAVATAPNPDAPSIKPGKEPPPAEPAENKPLNILIAEDNDLNRDLLQEILEMNGMKVVAACDGQEAVDLFSHSGINEFDVILMDMNMPVLDGIGATKAIRGLARRDAGSVPIYACTANSFEEDRDRCLGAGMSGFLAKPVDFAKLLELMNQFSAEK